jgi:hypothetical protein
MSNSYDEKGNYTGKTDSNGNHWDKGGSYIGKTDSNGNHWDKGGNYTGKTDSNGNHWDKGGSYIGKTDSNGNYWDKGGSYAGKNNSSGGGGDSSGGSSSGGDLAGGLAIILLPFIIGGAVIFGVLAIVFGIPFFALTYLYTQAVQIVGNIAIATIYNVVLSLLICALDILIIIYFFPRLKAIKKGKIAISYLVILLFIPWLAIAGSTGILNSIAFEQANEILPNLTQTGANNPDDVFGIAHPKTYPPTILKVGEAWNHNDVVLLLNDVSFYTRGISIANLYIENQGVPDVYFLGETQYFTLTDNNGKSYSYEGFNYTGYYLRKNDRVSIRVFFKDDGNFLEKYLKIDYPQIKYFLFTVNVVFGVKDATWKIDVAK